MASSQQALAPVTYEAVRPAGPVPTFLANGLTRVDPGMSSAFDKARARLNQQQIERAEFERVRIAASKWRTAMQLFKKESKVSVVSKFDLAYAYGPRDVIAAVGRAADNYDEKGLITKNPVRAFGREMAEYQSFLKVLFDFIPNNEYTSVLCGALCLLMSAAAEVSEVRKSINTCLQSLRRGFSDTEQWSQIYDNEQSWPRLWAAAEDLYVALLQAAEHMISWLDESAWKHAWKSFGSLVKPGSYSKDFEKKTKLLVDAKVVAFRDQIESCLHQRVKQTQELAFQGRELAAQGNIKMDHMLWQQFEQQQISEQTLDQSGEILSTTRGLKATIEVQLSDLVKLLERNAEATEAREKAHEERYNEQVERYNAQEEKLKELQESFNRSQQPAKMLLSALSLHQMLAVPQHSSATDLEEVQDTCRKLRPKSRQRATAILSDERFRSWLTDATSQVLLLNAMDRIATTSCSAVTYCVARVSGALASSNRAMPLTFFCGEHTDPDDSLRGVAGMLRGLCAQLLLTLPPDTFLTMDSQELIEAVRQGNSTALSDLYRLLLIEIARRSGATRYVVCMVDDIGELEDSEEASVFASVIRHFQSVCDELAAQGNPIILKILLASRTSSADAETCFDESNVLTMPSDIFGIATQDPEDEELLEGMRASAPL